MMQMREKRPRLLFLVTEDWYFIQHRLALARVARSCGYEVVVATRVQECGPQLAAEGFKVIPIKLLRSSRNPVFEWSAVRELVGVYRREKPDIVHHVGMKPILYGTLAARMARIGGVVNAFAGLGYVYTATGWRMGLLRRVVSSVLRSTIRLTDGIAVFENADDREEMRRRGVVTPERSVVVSGTGVDLKEFYPVPEPRGDPVVLLAARMLADKGVREFVVAAGNVKRHGIRARFVLAGMLDPANPSCIGDSELREWQDSGVVEWLGHCETMPELIRRSHIVVLPSYREGLPRVLLEASASARAIVATDVQGCRDVVRHGVNGLLIPARDSDALTEAITKLVQDPELRQRMGERGREIVQDGFSVERVTSKTMRVYGKVLEGVRAWS